MVGESLENFSLEGVQQQGETVKKAWVSFLRSKLANQKQSVNKFVKEIRGEKIKEELVTIVFCYT